MDSYSCPAYTINPHILLLDEDTILLRRSSSNGKFNQAVVYASKTKSLMKIFFLKSLSEVKVTIKKIDNSVIFSKTINTVSGYTKLVDMGNFDEGDYIISISNNDEGILSGKFSLTNTI